jgi:hypothetical protein
MMKLWYVNAYEVSSAYGGPEEGGWYYTEQLLEKTLKMFVTRKQAEDYAEITNNKMQDITSGNYQMGHGAHDGVDDNGEPDDDYLLPGGHWGECEMVALVEDHKGRDKPEEQPYYC